MASALVTLCHISPIIRGLSSELESSTPGGPFCLLSIGWTTEESLFPQVLVLVDEALGEDEVNGTGLRSLRAVRLVHVLSDGECSLSLLDVPSSLAFCLRGDLLRLRSLRGGDWRKERCRGRSLRPVIDASSHSWVDKATVSVGVIPPRPTVGEDEQESLSSSLDSNDIKPESTSCCSFASNSVTTLESPLLCVYSAYKS